MHAPLSLLSFNDAFFQILILSTFIKRSIHSGIVTGCCSRCRVVTCLASFNLAQASFTSIYF